MHYTIQPGFPEAARSVAAGLFWQAFGAKLGLVLRPERKALRWLEGVLDPMHALSAVADDGELLGIAGYKTRDGAFVGGTLRELARTYGWIGATIRGMVLELLERDLAGDQLLMDGIFVTEQARGLGIGSALLDAIKAEAAHRGLHEVRLDVIDSNPRARALYERHGFEAGATSHLGPLRYVFGFRSATTMVARLDSTAAAAP